jgi:hypothetical protein
MPSLVDIRSTEKQAAGYLVQLINYTGEEWEWGGMSVDGDVLMTQPVEGVHVARRQRDPFSREPFGV